jgi:hypothetical protein
MTSQPKHQHSTKRTQTVSKQWRLICGSLSTLCQLVLLYFNGTASYTEVTKAKGMFSSVGCLPNLHQLLWLCKYIWGMAIDCLATLYYLLYSKILVKMRTNLFFVIFVDAPQLFTVV